MSSSPASTKWPPITVSEELAEDIRLFQETVGPLIDEEYQAIMEDSVKPQAITYKWLEMDTIPLGFFLGCHDTRSDGMLRVCFYRSLRGTFPKREWSATILEDLIPMDHGDFHPEAGTFSDATQATAYAMLRLLFLEINAGVPGEALIDVVQDMYRDFTIDILGHLPRDETWMLSTTVIKRWIKNWVWKTHAKKKFDKIVEEKPPKSRFELIG